MPLRLANAAPAPRSVDDTSSTRRASTTSTSRTAVPKGMVAINKMGAGEAFHFTSEKKDANTGLYIRVNSKKDVSALNLNTFKVVTFNDGEYGQPEDLEINRAR